MGELIQFPGRDRGETDEQRRFRLARKLLQDARSTPAPVVQIYPIRRVDDMDSDIDSLATPYSGEDEPPRPPDVA